MISPFSLHNYRNISDISLCGKEQTISDRVLQYDLIIIEIFSALLLTKEMPS